MEIKKKSANHDWTDTEDAILMEHMTTSKGSVRKRLEEAATLLNVTFYMTRNRWHKHLLPKLESNEPLEHDPIYNLSDTPNMSSQVKELMDDFIETMVALQKKNKMLEQKVIDQDKRLVEQQRIMRDMAEESKDLKESYVYILKVMEKARKMFAEDEMKEIVHKVDNTGNVVDTKRSAG